ncbi:unnamed protein product [Moneuplotes crassus]|uniref:Uncharacterized protein n=1 Tax=Euplotes crassus TaxID=5936 RepID=A0AAD2D9U4_EUPCR|nr:unnamed protein product [Moneuplotes crassus]
MKAGQARTTPRSIIRKKATELRKKGLQAQARDKNPRNQNLHSDIKTLE